MSHICLYRTLAPDTYFCPLCRQLVYRGRVIVVPVLADEDALALQLWLSATQAALAHAISAWEAVADFAPPSRESLESLLAFTDRLRLDLARPAWQHRLRYGPRWIVRARRGARYGRSQRLVASFAGCFTPSRQALLEMRRLGIHYRQARANVRRFRRQR